MCDEGMTLMVDYKLPQPISGELDAYRHEDGFGPIAKSIAWMELSRATNDLLGASRDLWLTTNLLPDRDRTTEERTLMMAIAGVWRTLVNVAEICVGEGVSGELQRLHRVEIGGASPLELAERVVISAHLNVISPAIDGDYWLALKGSNLLARDLADLAAQVMTQGQFIRCYARLMDMMEGMKDGA